MTWDYRVVREDDGEDKLYEVREVYYDEDGKPVSVTTRGVALAAETVEGLALVLPSYLKALTLPVLDGDKLSEIEPPISKQALAAAK